MVKINSSSIFKKLTLLASIVYVVLTDAVSFIVGHEGSRFGGMILAAQLSIIVVLCFVKSKGIVRVKYSLFHIYLLFFIFYCFVNSLLWALDKSFAMSRSIHLAQYSVMAIIFYLVYQNDNDVDRILKIIMFSGFFLIITYVMYYGWGYITNMLNNNERITSEAINANTLGMSAAYSIVIFVYYVLKKQAKIWWTPLVGFSVLILAASQSRKAIVIIILGCSGIFLLMNFGEKSKQKVYIRYIVAVLLLIFISVFLKTTSFFSGVEDRINGLLSFFYGGQVDKSTELRTSFIDIGVDLFKEHKIVGVGIDCARFYTYEIYHFAYHLHNNYIELLADGGLIGFVAYYWIYLYMLIQYLKHRNFSCPEYNICLIIMIIRLIMDFGFVSYKDQSTYLFLLLMFMGLKKHVITDNHSIFIKEKYFNVKHSK